MICFVLPKEKKGVLSLSRGDCFEIITLDKVFKRVVINRPNKSLGRKLEKIIYQANMHVCGGVSSV